MTLTKNAGSIGEARTTRHGVTAITTGGLAATIVIGGETNSVRATANAITVTIANTTWTGRTSTTGTGETGIGMMTEIEGDARGRAHRSGRVGGTRVGRRGGGRESDLWIMAATRSGGGLTSLTPCTVCVL